MEMSILTQFIQSSVESGYFSTALLMLVIFGLWRLYKAEQERGRDFGIRFANEIRQLIETNNNALKELIGSVKDLSTRQDIESKHGLEMRNRLESEFKELKSEVHHLQTDVKELKSSVSYGRPHRGGGYIES